MPTIYGTILLLLRVVLVVLLHFFMHHFQFLDHRRSMQPVLQAGIGQHLGQQVVLLVTATTARAAIEQQQRNDDPAVNVGGRESLGRPHKLRALPRHQGGDLLGAERLQAGRRCGCRRFRVDDCAELCVAVVVAIAMCQINDGSSGRCGNGGTIHLAMWVPVTSTAR